MCKFCVAGDDIRQDAVSWAPKRQNWKAAFVLRENRYGRSKGSYAEEEMMFEISNSAWHSLRSVSLQMFKKYKYSDPKPHFSR